MNQQELLPPDQYPVPIWRDGVRFISACGYSCWNYRHHLCMRSPDI